MMATTDGNTETQAVQDQFGVDFVHAGPGTLAGRYLRSFWQPIYVSRDLPPGKAMPITLMSEQLTLYRGERQEAGGEGGQPHLVAFRCAHRGTQLSTGWVEGDEIRCFYHGWKYDANGQCTEQPAEPEPFCSRIKIRSYPVREYLGLIFAFLGEGEPPEFPRFQELEEFADGVLHADGGAVVPCNFFNRIDQSADNLHTYFAHRESFVEDGGLQGIPTLTAEITEYGVHIHNSRPNGIEGDGHFQMPNINFFAAPPRLPDTGWTSTVVWRLPVDDEHYIAFTITMVPVHGGEDARQRVKERLLARSGPRTPEGSTLTVEELGEEILAGRAHWLDFPDRSSNTWVAVQDYVSLVGQGAYAPREHDHLGRTDVGIALIRQLWRQELQALAEGRPLTRWTRPKLTARYTGVGA
jgi:5,5'-dehydrodivanillate O-demethylase